MARAKKDALSEVKEVPAKKVRVKKVNKVETPPEVETPPAYVAPQPKEDPNAPGVWID